MIEEKKVLTRHHGVAGMEGVDDYLNDGGYIGLRKALEKKPEERFQSISDMLIELKRLKRDFSSALNTSSRDIPIITSSKRWIV